MKSGKTLIAITSVLLISTACGQAPSNTPSPPTVNLPNGPTLRNISGPNVLLLTVNGSQCSTSNMYPNEPCVSVTVCNPNNANQCVIINDILVDTGSFGLRVFSSVLTSASVALTQITSGGNPLAECVQYGDGSSDWGPVQLASVILGNEPAVQVPMQVIDSTYPGLPSGCGTPDNSPAKTGFNGILGVGLFAQDCGSGCETDSNNGVYYTCSGSTCTGAAVSLANQVQNPVTLLPTDNNGVILELPKVSLGGTSSANGYLVLGINTQSNNIPSQITTYPTDKNGDFSTQYNGNTITSFLDSGSNGLFFSASLQTPDCNGSSTGWFCPSSTLNLSAVNLGISGSPSGTIAFNVGNYNNLAGSNNAVFSELAGDIGNSQIFDWGLPFYLGRNVYTGFDGTTSSLGTGPYWAY